MSPLMLVGFALDAWADLLEECASLTRDVANRLFDGNTPKAGKS
jgi:hypothetical protein